MKSLRSYNPMRRVSKKLLRAQEEFLAVYALVDQRSEGRCEVRSGPTILVPTIGDGGRVGIDPEVSRCPKRATDHHHTVKPRRSHHDADLIVALCREHHDRCDWPYDRGRLSVSPLGKGRFLFKIIHAADKFSFTIDDCPAGYGEPPEGFGGTPS